MKKKLITAITASIATLAIASTAFAAPNYVTANYTSNSNYGYRCDTMNILMWDDNGNLVDRDTFEDRLDAAIKDKSISSDDKNDYLDMYDYCTDDSGRYGGDSRSRGLGRCH